MDVERMHAKVGRIEALLMAQQFEDAHVCAVDALVAAPDDHRLLVALARADLHLGSLERALWAADRACGVAPDQGAVHFVRAEILGAMGRHRQQLRAVTAGLALSPGSNHGRQMLARTTARMAARRSARRWLAATALLTVVTAAGAAFVTVPHGAAWGILVVAGGICTLAMARWVHRRHEPITVSFATAAVELRPVVLTPTLASAPTPARTAKPAASAPAAPVTVVATARPAESLRPMIAVGR